MKLDARQSASSLDCDMPVLRATQLAAFGLAAFGLEAKGLALNENVIGPRPLLTDKVLFGRGVAGR